MGLALAPRNSDKALISGVRLDGAPEGSFVDFDGKDYYVSFNFSN